MAAVAASCSACHRSRFSRDRRRNTSNRVLEEVAQLYIHQRYGRAARPVRELKAFERVRLEAGETRTLKFELSASARRYWSATDKAYVLVPEIRSFLDRHPV